MFLDYGEWWYLPLGAAVGLAVVFVVDVGAAARRSNERRPPSGAARPPVPRRFWLYAAALVIYGVGRDDVRQLGHHPARRRGVASTSATYALAAFWAAVTAGRLVIALVPSHVRSTRIYVVLPWLIALALLVAPAVDTAAGGIAMFALAGLACSGFFPMTIGYGESRFPAIVEVAAGWLIAAYQVGYGLAAFGGGALQDAVSLTTIFRLAALLALGMGVLALLIARQRRVGAARLSVRSVGSG